MSNIVTSNDKLIAFFESFRFRMESEYSDAFRYANPKKGFEIKLPNPAIAVSQIPVDSLEWILCEGYKVFFRRRFSGAETASGVEAAHVLNMQQLFVGTLDERKNAAKDGATSAKRAGVGVSWVKIPSWLQSAAQEIQGAYATMSRKFAAIWAEKAKGIEFNPLNEKHVTAARKILAALGDANKELVSQWIASVQLSEAEIDMDELELDL